MSSTATQLRRGSLVGAVQGSPPPLMVELSCSTSHSNTPLYSALARASRESCACWMLCSLSTTFWLRTASRRRQMAVERAAGVTPSRAASVDEASSSFGAHPSPLTLGLPWPLAAAFLVAKVRLPRWRTALRISHSCSRASAATPMTSRHVEVLPKVMTAALTSAPPQPLGSLER
eukprot:jgi/Chrpa1/25056/Chrysochromulina_OHIO_Genome00000235-RA